MKHIKEIKKNKYTKLIEKQEYQKHHNKKLWGTSKYKLNIITEVNYDKICFLTPACFGRLKQNITNYVLNSYLKNIELLISDMELTYETYCKTNNIEQYQIKSTLKTANRKKLLPIYYNYF